MWDIHHDLQHTSPAFPENPAIYRWQLYKSLEGNDLIMKKTIGIIGGMGPLATSDLFRKIIELTPASCDQDHIHVCIDCNTSIPDRTRAILSGGEDPVPQLVRSGLRLQGMGADLLVMPCNTAHYFYDRLLPFFDVPLLHMLRETAQELRRQGVVRAGILATDGTLQTGLYHRFLAEEGIEAIVPEGPFQAAVMEVIYDGVKAGKRKMDLASFRRTAESLFQKGAQTLVLGCTELPVAFDWYSLAYPHIDPTAVLAQAAVQHASAAVAGKTTA